MTAARRSEVGTLGNLKIRPQPIAAIAHVLSLSGRRVQQLARAGVVVRTGRGRYDLLESVRGYVAFLHEQLQQTEALRASGLYEARARREAAKARLTELELGRRVGTLLERDAVAAHWQQILLVCKERIRAIPAKAEQQLKLDRTQRRGLLEMIDDVLRELSRGDGLPRRRSQ